MKTTADAHLELIAPGTHVTVRDEQWLVRAVESRGVNGRMVRCIGMSELVRDREATFFSELDRIEPLQPEAVKLVGDESPGFRRSRLFLEALLRKTPLPAGETRLAVGHNQLLDALDYQKRPAQMALESLRPRLLIADAVGLGKTLEVGIVLSELIRRGRGERILVVTPRHILEQFQHELWTRFSIPLVRLDSEGIQRVRQKIPSNRNPFSFYKRVIISIDTLKNPGRYRHHLEGIHWDVAVFDECHNLVNSGSLNNELAKVVAPTTRALLLTSATPHNGDQRSFARLVDLLDPTAIVDRNDFGTDDIAHLFIRRHKATEEVESEVGSEWAPRTEPKPIMVAASPAEDAVFDELARTWLRPESGEAPVSGRGRRLFPYTLLKAALSSHKALAETVAERRKRIAAAADGELTDVQRAEDDALARLGALAEAVTDDDSAKLAALGAALDEIGVGKDSTTRVVIFSERVATLNWIAERLPELTGLAEDQIEVMHGGCSDIDQQRIVEQFALEGSKVRVLVTGDIASEGVNLHRQCHHLIHFDLPWSLIRLEQRNGRIDRYGQRHNPEIRALLLTPSNPEGRSDVTVLTKLLDKEHNAHLALGDAASVMGLNSVEREEERVMEALAAASSEADKAAALDEAVPDEPDDDSFDFSLFLTGGAHDDTIETVTLPSLFEDDESFLRESLYEIAEDPVRDFELREEADQSVLSLVPPDDLVRRLDVLPKSYLDEQRITQRLKLTSDRDVAQHMLDQARRSQTSMWPEVGFLSNQHPIMDWAVDKVLVRLGRNEAPVIECGVSQPTFLLQGVYSNAAGEPTVVRWMAVDGLDAIPSVTDDFFGVLAAAGVDHTMVNPASVQSADVLARLQALVPRAVEVGREHMRYAREDLTFALDRRIDRYRERLEDWKSRRRDVIDRMGSDPQRIAAVKEMERHVASTKEHIDSLRTVGEPLVRVVAVLVGRE